MIDWNYKNGLYLIGFYPVPETSIYTRSMFERCYGALADSYGCNIMLINEPSEYNDLLAHIPIIAIEEETKFTEPLAKFEHPEQAIYVTGNTKYQWPSGHFDNVKAKVHIPTPVFNAPLYGFQAAAIILHDRYMKNGTNI